MTDITKETVATARNAPTYSVAITGSAALIVTCDQGVAAHEGLTGKRSLVRVEHFDITVELCRQQHEALLIGQRYMENGNRPTSADRQTVDAVLALMPDDPTEEVER